MELGDPIDIGGVKFICSSISTRSENFRIIESIRSWVFSESKLGGYEWGPGKCKKLVEYMNESKCGCFCIALMGIRERVESTLDTTLPKCTPERAVTVEGWYWGHL